MEDIHSVKRGIVDANGFVTSPIDFNQPLFTIAPLSAEQLALNAVTFRNPDGPKASDQIKERFPDRHVTIAINGRAALRAILQDLGLKKEDSVSIYTTSGNHYISSCVTSVIEEFCLWHREEVKPETKAILVNHEFGYPVSMEKLVKLKSLGIPLIEDCAYSLGCRYDTGEEVGTFGDYSFFSLAKIFGIQIGGFALADKSFKSPLTDYESNYIERVVGPQFMELRNIIEARREAHREIAQKLSPLGITPLVDLAEGMTPGVFLFKTSRNLDLSRLKKYLWSMGIQCSVFYGMEAFYIPCHQASSPSYMDMMHSLLNSFIHES